MSARSDRHPWLNSLMDGGPWKEARRLLEQRIDRTSLTETLAPWQARRVAPAIPRRIAEMAYEEYADMFGRGQSFERMCERGGLGVGETLACLADRIERLERERLTDDLPRGDDDGT